MQLVTNLLRATRLHDRTPSATLLSRLCPRRRLADKPAVAFQVSRSRSGWLRSDNPKAFRANAVVSFYLRLSTLISAGVSIGVE